MIDDRNLFRPHITPHAVADAARELDALSARHADAVDTVDGLLREADGVIDRIGARRNALAVQAGILNAAVALPGNVGDPEARLGAALTMIAAVDDFVGVRVPRMEAAARDTARGEAERLDIARRLRDAAAKILRAVGDVDPIGDAVDDVKRLADDIAKTTAGVVPQVASDLSVIVVGVAIIAVVLLVRDLVR